MNAKYVKTLVLIFQTLRFVVRAALRGHRLIRHGNSGESVTEGSPRIYRIGTKSRAV